MRAHTRLASALVLALVYGCASKARQQERIPTFAGAFDVLETRPGTKGAVAPRTTLVDYASQITVQPDRPALEQLISEGQTVDRALGRAERAELDARIQEASRKLESLDELAVVIERIGAYEEATVRYYAQLETDRVLQDDPGFQDLAQRRGDIMEALRNLAYLHYESVVVGHAVDWTEPEDEDSPEAEALVRRKDERSAMYTLMAPDPQGAPNQYDAAQVTRVLNETLKVLHGNVEELERALVARAPKAEIEMEAALYRGRESIPISITPYTVVEGIDRGKKSPRVGIPGPDELKRVQETYAAYEECANALNELKETFGTEGALDDLLKAFREQLRESAARLRDGLLADLAKAADLDGPRFEAIRTHAIALKQQLEDLEREVRALSEASGPVEFTRLVVALLEELRSSRAGRIAGEIEKLRSALKELPADLEGDVRALLERLKASVDAEADHVLDALEGTPGGAALGRLLRSIKALAELANARSFGDLEPGAIQRKAFSIDAAQDATVDLADSPAEAGDRLAVRYRVTTSPGTDEKREYRSSTWLDVRKFGLYTTLKSQLLFYDRLNDGTSSYKAAPGVAFNFHYRPEGWQTFFDTVAPGLGVSVSSPSFEEGAELAVGLQLTLFNDALQTGYARNLSVTDDREMFYFGLDLIGAFQRIQ